jgi:hypothetical protein
MARGRLSDWLRSKAPLTKSVSVGTIAEDADLVKAIKWEQSPIYLGMVRGKVTLQGEWVKASGALISAFAPRKHALSQERKATLLYRQLLLLTKHTISTIPLSESGFAIRLLFLVQLEP